MNKKKGGKEEKPSFRRVFASKDHRRKKKIKIIMTKKKIIKRNDVGIAFIKATFNNTLITITDLSGNAVQTQSGGSCGFKGARKSTPFARRTAGIVAGKNCGFEKIHVIVSGAGPGKESAIRGLQIAGLQIGLIRDRTNVPHNGCRPPKRRRV
nr:ribosomal protein S11 [Trentepohlia sp. YN1317]